MTPGQVPITAADVEFYHREGYFVYNHQVFPPEKFQALKDHFEYLLNHRPEGKRPEDLDVPHFGDTKLFEWLLSDEVLDLVEPFIGPNIALWSSHFIAKPGGGGRAVPWHEDSYLWKGLLEPQEVITLWLAIDDADPENGSMRVIPRTHDNGFSQYHNVDLNENVFAVELNEDQMDMSRVVDMRLKAGECHFHHAKLMHGSNANFSNRRRCGYTMRYMSTAVKFVGQDNPNFKHNIYLARGKDLAGNRYGDPTKVYPELVR
jgi:hypothetical protein